LNKKGKDTFESISDSNKRNRRERPVRSHQSDGLKDPIDLLGTKGKKPLFLNLIKALHTILEFEDACILQMQDDQRMLTMVSTAEKLQGVFWKPDTLFKRVLSGRPVATVDINRASEWASQPEKVRKNIGSALHVNLEGGRLAILVLTHSIPGYFGLTHIRLVNKFAPLASQALLTLDLQRAVIQRDRFFQLSLDLMGIFDYSGNFKQFNESWKMILGYEADEFFRKNLFAFIHQDDCQMFVEAIRMLKRTGEHYMVEGRFRRKNGSYCWLSCSLAVYRDEKLCYMVGRDVTDRVLVEQQLAYDARHDPLTGLYNRIEFMERLGIAFARSVREPAYAFAILYLDLNGFKAINDMLGHDVGDALLKKVSECLMDVVREVDTVARLGGDEFTILLDGIHSPEQMVMVIERIHQKLSHPFILKHHQVATSVSIGVSISSPLYENAEHMLRDADSAMYRAKLLKHLPYILNQNNGCFYPPCIWEED
jgi:diguanylate cyclase (GGDEF)-like protein/PAS domain S-box-containing protein